MCRPSTVDGLASIWCIFKQRASCCGEIDAMTRWNCFMCAAVATAPHCPLCCCHRSGSKQKRVRAEVNKLKFRTAAAAVICQKWFSSSSLMAESMAVAGFFFFFIFHLIFPGECIRCRPSDVCRRLVRVINYAFNLSSLGRHWRHSLTRPARRYCVINGCVFASAFSLTWYDMCECVPGMNPSLVSFLVRQSTVALCVCVCAYVPLSNKQLHE